MLERTIKGYSQSEKLSVVSRDLSVIGGPASLTTASIEAVQQATGIALALDTDLMPRHLLAGISRTDDSVAKNILESLGVTSFDLTAIILRDRAFLQAGHRKTPDTRELVNRVYMYANAESMANQDGYIGTEHLLLALVASEPAEMKRTLDVMRFVDTDIMRTEIHREKQAIITL